MKLFLHAVSSDSAWSCCNTNYHFLSFLIRNIADDELIIQLLNEKVNIVV